MDEHDSTILSCRSFSSDELECQVTALKDLLKNDNLTADTKSLLDVLELSFSLCEPESLDEKIFSIILPEAHRSVSQVVKAINDTTGDNGETDNLHRLTEKLYICSGLLVFWRKCVEHVSGLANIRMLHAKSLYEILPGTIKIVFEHCKASPGTYGALLSGATRQLKDLFSEATTILRLFFGTLESVIVLGTDVESETALLTKVVDAHGSIAAVAYGMDTKTFVEMSEAFGKLAIVYQSDIKHESPTKVTLHLLQMANDISHLLSTSKDPKDKSAERAAVVAMRLLRILEKLTSAYSLFLTKEMMLRLVQLLTEMHGYSYSNVARSGEKAIAANTASLLCVLFDNKDFKQTYFEYGKRADVNQLNYHLLTVAIVKKLNGMRPEEFHHDWLSATDSILDVALRSIEHLQREICIGELRLPSAHEIGERPREAGIYEVTLVAVCDLVAHIPQEGFHALELLLLQHLLSGRLWSALLSSDIWCFVGRLGTSDLCVDHIKHLTKVSIALADRSNSMEVIMLNNIIASLYELLDNDRKSCLLSELVELDTLPSALYCLAAQTGVLRTRFAHLSRDLKETFSNLQEHPTVNNWKHLMQLLSAIETMPRASNASAVDVLIKVWNFVESTIDGCEGKQLDILSDLILVLLDSTWLGNFEEDTFHSILRPLAASYIYMPSGAKIKTCQYVRKNVEHLCHCRSRSAPALTVLFDRLLEDEDACVRQEALETFEHVGHTCPEHLVARVAKALARIPSISNVMQAYLSHTSYYVLKDHARVQDYLVHLIDAYQRQRNAHACYLYDDCERNEKIPKLESENSPVVEPKSAELDQQVERLCEELTKVLEGRANVSDAACKKLLGVLEKILKAADS